MKKILIIPGSIRKDSLNKSICRYIQKSSTEDTDMTLFELDKIPMFNEDLEDDLPEEVERLVSEVKSADGVIICTPEYNNMLPGVVKNMMEWLSRGYSKPFVQEKPLLIMGATDGGFGTVRAQNQLHLLASLIGFKVNPAMKLPISHADQAINESGDITDDKVRTRIDEKVAAFVDILE